MEKETILKYMEYLIKELHKQWEKSGEPVKTVTIAYEAMDKKRFIVGSRICELTEYLNQGEGTLFKELKRSKESYILLRMVKKMVAAQKKAEKEQENKIISLSLDEEELSLYQKMFLV